MSDQLPPVPPVVTPPPVPQVLPTAHQTDTSPGWVDPETGTLYPGGKVPVSLLTERMARVSAAKKEADDAKAEAAKWKAAAEEHETAAKRAADKAAASTAFALMASTYPDLADPEVQASVETAAINYAKRNAKDGKQATIAEVLASEDFRKSPVVRGFFTSATPDAAPKQPVRPPPPDPNAGAVSGKTPRPLTDADFKGMTPAQALANRKEMEEHLASQGYTFGRKR